MKLLGAALCVLSVSILSGCVDDGGYRSGGYYASSVQYRSYDRDRYHRNYDRDRYYRNYDRRDYDRRDRDRRDYSRNPVTTDRSGNTTQWIDQGNGQGYTRAVVNGQVIYMTGKDVQGGR